MSSKIEKKENSVIELTLEISPEEFQKALHEAYRHEAKKFNIPGFRKGKAPYNIAMRYYGEAVLYDEAIDLALNPAYRAALEEHGIEPVVRPELDIREIGGDKGLTAVLMITVKPEVTLGDYLGVEAYKAEVKVTDEEVEAELNRVRERSGRMVPVEDRAAELKDIARIDFEGFLGDKAFDGGKAEGHDLELGSGSFIPGFEDQIVGHKPGETFDVTVTFPEEYGAKELAGQEARFVVTLHSLKVKELPDLDDEFAKDVSEFDTLAEYREDLRKNLLEKAEHREKHMYEDRVVEAVVANASVEIPEAMIEQDIDEQLQRQQQSMSYQGIQLNQYLQYIGKTLEEYRNEIRPSAERNLKTALVLEKVSETLNPEITDEDRDQEYERMAKQYGMKAEDLKTKFVDVKMIDNMIASRKTVDALVAASKPTDKKPAETENQEEK